MVLYVASGVERMEPIKVILIVAGSRNLKKHQSHYHRGYALTARIARNTQPVVWSSEVAARTGMPMLESVGFSIPLWELKYRDNLSGNAYEILDNKLSPIVDTNDG